MARDASQITREDAERQGWHFTNTSLDYSPNAAYLASEDGDFRQVQATYDNDNFLTFYVNYDDGVILAQASYRANKDLYNWSTTIIMIAWKDIGLQFGGDPKHLTRIVRVMITNPITTGILNELDNEHPEIIEEPTERTALDKTKNPDAYYSMIGVPNGYGVAYLLFEHRAYFGFKTFSKIEVENMFGHVIWYSFKNVEQPAPVPSACA